MIPQIVQGIGFGTVFIALSTVAHTEVYRRNMTSATGLYNLIRQLGGSFGTAVVVTILTNKTQDARAALVPYASVNNDAFVNDVHSAAGMFQHEGYSAVTAMKMDLKSMEDIITQQSFMLGYEYVFYCIGLLFVICIPLVLLLSKRAKKPNAVHEVAD